MIGFLAVFTLLMATLHLYMWRRLVRDTGVALVTRRVATWALVLLSASIPLAMVVTRLLRAHWGIAVPLLGNTWLGVMFYAVVCLFAIDLLWLARRLGTRLSQGHDAPPIDPARRQALARMGAATTLATTGAISSYGLWSGLGDIETPEVEIKLPRLPPQLSGYRIAQLTDVHIGDLLGTRFLRGVVEQTNRQRPDLIVITGDLVDGSVRDLGAAVAELRQLRARDGVCFVTGNHEYYSGAESWIEFLRGLGIQVLMNQRITVGDARANFDVIGVPDHRAHPVRPDMQLAARGRDPERELVVLAHQPVQVRDAVGIGAGLQISGHTHGGQLFPFGALTALVQPHLAGLEHAGGATQIYVSRGTGFWGPPMRVLAPAEISTLILTP